VPQGGVISPLLSNIYLNEVDCMLEKAKETTRHGKYTEVEYARFADDLVILVSWHPNQNWLVEAVDKRLREELAKVQVEVNEEKTRTVDLMKGESFTFLGFRWWRVQGKGSGKWRPLLKPLLKKRKELTEKITKIFGGTFRSLSARSSKRSILFSGVGWPISEWGARAGASRLSETGSRRRSGGT